MGDPSEGREREEGRGNTERIWVMGSDGETKAGPWGVPGLVPSQRGEASEEDPG